MPLKHLPFNDDCQDGLNGVHEMEKDSTAPPHAEISQWVIYAQPLDYPTKYVLRRWDIRANTMIATDEMALAETLAEIRKKVPPGLYRLARYDDDDPCIVEVWL